ncbi:hypothetical protein [Methylobacterium sp. E-066]|nr:hypothetical protein [Methylobacterium sp. E-066]MCJ2141159.1 hypothetical protein [Methylobacterium sp. E-066]
MGAVFEPGRQAAGQVRQAVGSGDPKPAEAEMLRPRLDEAAQVGAERGPS